MRLQALQALLLLFASSCSSLSTQRLDAALVARGLISSRAAAKTAIQKGLVFVDEAVVKKASQAVADSTAVRVTDGAAGPYVSRAGEKLRGALDAFNIDLSNAAVLDVGASTGGFTDCALQKGAASVVCVDCGHDQLDSRLIGDDRVTNLEGINARSLTADLLPRAEYNAIVVDVSFISLKLILPAIWPLLSNTEDARLIALVKPQFECGKESVKRGKGIVKDIAEQERALRELEAFATAELEDCVVAGSMESPILGGDGQREFLMALAIASKQASELGGPFYEARAVASKEEDAEEEVDPLQPVTMARPKTAAARAAKHRNDHRKSLDAKGRKIG